MLKRLIKEEKEEQSTRLDFYVMSMSSLWKIVKNNISDPNDNEKAIIDDIEIFLNNPEQDWVKAYRTEQLIVPFMSEIQLNMRCEARLSEAKERLFLFNVSTHENNWDAAKNSKKPTDVLEAKRAAFHALLDEIQWEYIGKLLNRRLLLEAARRLWIIGLAVLFLVSLPWLAFGIVSLIWDGFSSVMNDAAQKAPAFGLYTAISFGLLGAFFSRLNSFQSQAATLSYVQIRQIFRASFLIVRLGYGMVGSMILYFMLAGEFLQGNLFPQISGMALYAKTVTVWGINFSTFLPNAEFAKLVVWAFIGGFSERLIPAGLEKVEKGEIEHKSSDKDQNL